MAVARPHRRKKARKHRRKTRASEPRKTKKHPGAFTTSMTVQGHLRPAVRRHPGYKNARRTRRGQFNEARRARARAREAGRRHYRRRNPMVGGEMPVALLTGTAGYLLADFLDRMLASYPAKEGGTPANNAAVINGPPNLKRIAAQLGLAGGTLLLASYVRNSMGKSALQGLGLGAAVHGAVQGGKMLILQFVGTQGDEPSAFEYYPDLRANEQFARALTDAPKSPTNPYGTGTVQGRYGRLGAAYASAHPSAAFPAVAGELGPFLHPAARNPPAAVPAGTFSPAFPYPNFVPSPAGPIFLPSVPEGSPITTITAPRMSDPVFDAPPRTYIPPTGTVYDIPPRTYVPPYATVNDPPARTITPPTYVTVNDPPARTYIPPYATVNDPPARTITPPGYVTVNDPPARTITPPGYVTVTDPPARTITPPFLPPVTEPPVFVPPGTVMPPGTVPPIVIPPPVVPGIPGVPSMPGIPGMPGAPGAPGVPNLDGPGWTYDDPVSGISYYVPPGPREGPIPTEFRRAPGGISEQLVYGVRPPPQYPRMVATSPFECPYPMPDGLAGRPRFEFRE